MALTTNAVRDYFFPDGLLNDVNRVTELAVNTQDDGQHVLLKFENVEMNLLVYEYSSPMMDPESVAYCDVRVVSTSHSTDRVQNGTNASLTWILQNIVLWNSACAPVTAESAHWRFANAQNMREYDSVMANVPAAPPPLFHF